jgi:hypothetical protein
MSRRFNAWSWGLLLLPAVPWFPTGTAASELIDPGREIYSRQCVECHGAQGEGVKGKYDEPLHGDWSMARLARVITRTMPEEDPNECVGEDAEAVARYIYDAFYSREARARHHTPRVEVARLTNRQYLNTVSDLMAHFTGYVAPLPSERGLRGTYYDARRFNQEKKIEERLDRGVDFDFGEGSPDPDRIKAEEFAIQWRGSVIAEETGDYEFILRTPNGARLWVNDQSQELIDAWVASGESSEHKARLRLIGGRAYPLRLDFFKFKDKTAAISLHWKAPHRASEPIPARNLSPQTTKPIWVVSTPFPPDDSSVGYERGVAVSKAWDEAATHAAIETANYVVRHLEELAGTKQDASDRVQKIEAFALKFVERAFRRPLTADQKTIFQEHLKTPGNLESGIKRVVLLALKSPGFLYLGLNGNNADDYEMASRLSFALWDSLPDPKLFQRAAEGKLRTPDQVRKQARLMLEDPRTKSKTHYFLHQWLQTHHVEDLTKDPDLYPDFNARITDDLRTSLDLFLQEAIWSGSSDYRELLLADYLFLNERLAEFYGVEVENNRADDFVKVRLDPQERSGVVTHPFLLSAFSYRKTTSPIHRGVFLTRNIMGRALKAPPVAVEFNDTEFAPDLTMREKVAELTRAAACQNCHSVINPLGFSLEHYDAVGRYRTWENDRLVDAASDYITAEDELVRLTGARDVAEFAALSEQAQHGFIEQLFHQMVKQPLLAYGPKAAARLHQSFVDSEYNVQQLLVEIAATAALHGTQQPGASP